jgi:hypothetical protein
MICGNGNGAVFVNTTTGEKGISGKMEKPSRRRQSGCSDPGKE